MTKSKIMTPATFEAVQQKLRTLDTVLSDSLLELGSSVDRGNGFDPQRTYTESELARIHPFGPEAFQRTDNESRYLLLGVTLDGNGQTFSEVYLRGFDFIINSHPTIATAFLQHDLAPFLEGNCEVPLSWEQSGQPFPRKIGMEFDGLTLTVTGLGGGKFDLRDKRINTKGSSKKFGPVPAQYQEQFRAMLELLVQKPAYQGFQVNLG